MLIKTKMANFRNKMDNIQTEMDKKFLDMDKRFEDVDAKLTVIRTTVDAVYDLLDGELKLKVTKCEVDVLRQRMTGVEEMVRDLKASQTGFLERFLKGLGLGDDHRD